MARTFRRRQATMKRIFFQSPCNYLIIDGKEIGTFGYSKVKEKLQAQLVKRGIELTNDPRPDDIQIHWGQPHLDSEHLYERKCDTFLWMCNFESCLIPGGWIGNINKGEALITTSKWCAEIFANSGVKVPIHIVHHGVDPEEFPYMERPAARENFTYLCQSLSLKYRRCEMAVEEVFNSLDFPDVRLLQKITPNVCPKTDLTIGKTRMIAKWHTTKEIAEFSQMSDILIHASIGEGFGLVPLEHLSMGLPSISTYFSGVTDYMDARFFLPLAWKPVRKFVNEPGNVQWGIDCEPDMGHLKELMIWAYNHRDDVRQMGIAGSKWVHEHWTWDRAVNQLIDVLRLYGWNN